jgi:uncharacterized protein (DUF2235 family)
MTEVMMAETRVHDENAAAHVVRNGARRPESRRVVVCCDGTWNEPDAAAPTNVARVAMGVAPADDTGTRQLLYYHPGVGTRRSERVSGGMFGYGLSRNVRDCYRYIVDTYQPGDQLYFFGFSRGAYTARSTVGLINNCGILRPEHRDRLDDAYRLYKSRDPLTHPRARQGQLFRRSYSWDDADIDIRFVGVWDTVGALGVPIDGLPIPRVLKRQWCFHDATLNDHVRYACQALAIDEKRGPFKPALWAKKPDAPKDQIVEQVWFAGDHCDVGGGHPAPQLSEIPLLWMVEHARGRGLAFKPDHFEPRDREPVGPRNETADEDAVAPDPLGEIHDSRKHFYRLLPSNERRLGAEDQKGQPVALRESAASSAQLRHEKKREYNPQSLADWLNANKRVTFVPDGSVQSRSERGHVPARP